MILICDDEAGIHESLRLYLERDGFAVRSVYRGDAVMEAFYSLSPDLIILDIGNTTVDILGYEVLCEGKKIVLSPKEVEIVHLLGGHPRQVFTREQLLDSIWGYRYPLRAHTGRAANSDSLHP